MRFVKHDGAWCPHCHLLRLAPDIERLRKAESAASERRARAADKVRQLKGLLQPRKGR